MREDTSLADALKTAEYIEKLFTTEQNWVTNRLSWLLMSQSFCILAYVTLVRTDLAGAQMPPTAHHLAYGLPVLGLVICLFVGLSVYAANCVVKSLIDQRAALTIFINKQIGVEVPLIGYSNGLRSTQIFSTYFFGSLPNWLPLVLILFWLYIVLEISVHVGLAPVGTP